MDATKTALYLISLVLICESANILYVVPFTSKSHIIMLKPIGLELARRGHNVTVITGSRVENAPPNYRQVMIDKKEIWEIIGGGRPNVFDMVQLSAEEFHDKIIWAGGLAFTELVLNSTEIKQFLSEDNHFDLVINEQFFQEALNLLAYKYKAPLILVTAYGNCMRHNIVYRNPLQLATTIQEFIDIKDPNNFWGRLRNFYFSAYEFFWWRFWYLEEQDKLAQKYLSDLPQPVPTLYEMQQNTAMILMNRHFSYDVTTAYLPNFIEVGGLHLSQSDSELPDDLLTILDESTNGVVYVNFGSNVRSSELPVDKKNAFLNVFRKLKQTVIWKWEEDYLENKPKNVVIRKWLPQKEILAHRNIHLFICHGGLIGTQEAIYNGIPIIGIPIYADQYNNLLLAEQQGWGKILEYNDINQDTLQNKLDEVLSNKKYTKNAKKISTLFRDRPMTPLDTAMYWIEYVIRNNGASYMRNPALEMSWIASNMLDVYAFISVVLLASLYFVYKIIAYGKSLTSKNSNGTVKSIKKKVA